jgi:putative Ig domain-containing protein
MVFSRRRCLSIPALAGAGLREGLGAAILLALSLGSAGAEPQRGDVDGDDSVNITDGIKVLNFLFVSGPAPYCMPVADANDDGDLNISDPVRLLNHLFLGNGDLPPLSEAEVDECSSDNLPPTLPERPTYRAYPGFLVEFPLAALDPEGDQLRYETAVLPEGASLDPDTGVFHWMPGMSDVGPMQVSFTVIDQGLPPNRVEGQLSFQVLTPDPCDQPECDPALGCDPKPIEDIGTECCGVPGPDVPDSDAACPEGAVLHVGRNSAQAPTIGRLQNCDGLRVAPLAQGGSGIHMNFEMRCLDPQQITIGVKLETADLLLVNSQRQTFLQEGTNGYWVKRSMGFNASDERFPEGTEGYLTVTVKDRNGVELTRRVRVVLTTLLLPDLP